MSSHFAGLDLVRRLIPDARRVLRAGGALVLETAGDAFPQPRAAATLLSEAGFVDVETRADLAGVSRFVAGRTPEMSRP